MFGNTIRIAAIVAFTLLEAATATAAQIHLTDFIPDDIPTNFNGFEGMLPGCCSPPFYAEDGITVKNLKQGKTESDVDKPGNNISTGQDWGNSGFSWYPVNGDFGYTQITRVGGLDFSSVGFVRGSSDLPRFLAYALLNDGVVVLNGTVGHTSSAQYLGFSGGGFDEILVRDRLNDDPTIDDNTYNALVIDSIELADAVATVPEPASMLLLASGIGALVLRRRLC